MNISVGDHFQTDEQQDGNDTVFEEFEFIQHGSQHEVHGAQAQDRKYVAGENEKGVGGDGEDGRNAVEGKEDVRRLDHQQGEQEGCAQQDLPAFDQKLLTVETACDGKHFADVAQQPVVFQIDFILIFRGPHFQCGIDNECAEDVDQPGKALDQGDPGEDHDGPEDHGSQDTPEQHPVLVFGGHLEVGEDQGHDKDIVKAQGELQQIAGEVEDNGPSSGNEITRQLSDPAPVVGVGIVHHDAEQQGK